MLKDIDILKLKLHQKEDLMQDKEIEIKEENQKLKQKQEEFDDLNSEMYFSLSQF